MEPAGRHALVSGGGRGIGRAVAGALAVRGARVTVLGRDVAALEKVVVSGLAAAFIMADVTDPAAVGRAVVEAEAALGPVEILVNNAGAAESAPFAATSQAVWERMLAVNLTSVFNLTRSVLPGMMDRRFGRIINIASTAGLRGYAYVAAYCAAKHGVVGLTRALAQEVARSGVTVNAVCPGYTETDLLTQSLTNAAAKTGRSEEQVRSAFLKSNPQGRFVRPAEVAAAVLFLCGDEADAMTGQAIAVAGGEIG